MDVQSSMGRTGTCTYSGPMSSMGVSTKGYWLYTKCSSPSVLMGLSTWVPEDFSTIEVFVLCCNFEIEWPHSVSVIIHIHAT